MSDAAGPKRKLRPARKQVKAGEVDVSEKVQPGKEYNVWYNKWAGGDKEDALANAECNFLHRLPLPTQLIDHSRDCFGREKHADYRDDMGGVGSFNRTNRTLYIAKMHESPDRQQTKETLLRHFGEWGKIDKWNVLYNRGIAFVTYRNEVNAQFAKEAMQNQSMDMDEILNVRWATEDPNPGEKKAEDRRLAREGQRVIASKLDEGLVEAAQTLRALEEGAEDEYYPIEASEGVEVQEDEGRPAKRTKGDDGKPQPTGLLGGEALENIKFYAEMRRNQLAEERARKQPATGMALLGGYSSGDESD